MADMHIVLDLQACQSPESRRRGIGRYSMSLAKAIAREPRGHEITILLNAAMSDSIEVLRGEFDGLLPPESIRVWQAMSPTASVHPGNAIRAAASAWMRDRVLERMRPDVVHVASLFEGLADDVIGTLRKDAPYLQAVTLYDLIPLAHPKDYLSSPTVRKWYMEKLEHLKRSDLLFGISAFSCREARDLLDFPEYRLTDISGAASDIFRKLKNPERFRTHLMKRYHIDRPFVMYAGGFDARKNIASLIRAFARLPLEVRNAYQLVIVGKPPEPERRALEEVIHETGLELTKIVFAGFVPDKDLVGLYNICALYVFPSLQEGFGLPALEAMSSGAPVIGSNTSSLPEVIGFDQALFDPYDVRAIADTMQRGLTDLAFREALLKHGREQPKKFAWHRSAQRALEAMEAAYGSRKNHGRSISSFSPVRGSVFIAAPGGNVPQDEAIVFADFPCQHASVRPLIDFSPQIVGERALIVELANNPYCAHTMMLAYKYGAELVFRDAHLGRALAALPALPGGEELLHELLHASGGYWAVASVRNSGYTVAALDHYVTPETWHVLGLSICPRPDERGADYLRYSVWKPLVRELGAHLLELPAAASGAKSSDLNALAEAFARNFVIPGGARRWFVDISNLIVRDAGTGIQRVVKKVLDYLIVHPPSGVRIEPVYLDDDGVLRYALAYCARRYADTPSWKEDEEVEFAQGDVYLGLDLVAHLIPAYKGFYRQMRDCGVHLYFVVYDLLPLLRPDCFETHLLPIFRGWYEAIAEIAEGIVCISQAVADEFESWLHQYRPVRERPLRIGYFHLGADLAPLSAMETKVEADEMVRAGPLDALDGRPTFMMVGTVEPRKGHAQVLAAFELLWEQGFGVNLLIVGRPGWLMETFIKQLRNHPRRGQRLFWFESADDDLLISCYRRASALVMASEGEGFGLPIIEAAHYGLPLLARDLPVFREIAGPHALYFAGYEPEDLAATLHDWLDLNSHDRVPTSTGIHWMTWNDSAQQLVDVLMNDRWVHSWKPGPLRRFAAYDYRLDSQVGELCRGEMHAVGEEGLLVCGPHVPLAAGCYKVIVHGRWLTNDGLAWMDIVSENASHIHVHTTIDPDDSHNDILAVVELVLEGDVDDLDLRIGVDDKTRLKVRELQIEPLETSKDVMNIPDMPMGVSPRLMHGTRS